MTEYAVGFMFQNRQVALILKKRPQWQYGLLNGIGGHVKEDETIMDAMEREFEEETGCRITNWQYYCLLASHEFKVHFFRCHGYLGLLYTATDEQIVIRDVTDLRNVVPNLKWLIPMALDRIDFAKVETDFLPGDS